MSVTDFEKEVLKPSQLEFNLNISCALPKQLLVCNCISITAEAAFELILFKLQTGGEFIPPLWDRK